MILFQETTSPRKRLDHAEAFQFRISFGDRVAVDAKFLSQRTDGWERLAGPQRPRCSRGLDLIDQLEIDGHAGLEIDLQYHASRLEEHTSELQSRLHLVCRLLLEKKKTK